MDSLLSGQSPPNSAFSDTRRSKFHLPLSNHGMPKTPGSTRPHRFSTIRTPTTPMSPPMSARSFGTFIDSEPSTPAYSPRMGSTWDNSTLVLLSPTSSAPSSPMEPTWEMVLPPIQKPKKVVATTTTTKSPVVTKEIAIKTSLSSHPVTPLPTQPNVQKENRPPSVEDDSETKIAAEEQQTQTTPLVGKLATRVKSILRRKIASDKKSEKKWKSNEEFDRLEDTHWTEM